MIFISKFGKYLVQVRPQVMEAYATGMAREVQAPLYAQFEVVGVTPEERNEAIRRFHFNGAPQNQDEATHVEPDYRISKFNSELAALQQSWSDEEREQVEKKLIEQGELFPQELFLMPVVEEPKPWPTYDEFKGTPAQLAKKVAEDGYDSHAVIAYEMTHLNRDAVIAALGALAAEQHEELTEADLEIVG